jgi:hypothetical protein
MSRLERTGVRDLTFSQWHRTLSDECTAIDIDLCEYCRFCGEALVLIEVARGLYNRKQTRIIRNLAKKAGITAILVLYESINGEMGPRVRVARVWPDPTEPVEIQTKVLGRRIEAYHMSHHCEC